MPNPTPLRELCAAATKDTSFSPDREANIRAYQEKRDAIEMVRARCSPETMLAVVEALELSIAAFDRIGGSEGSRTDTALQACYKARDILNGIKE